MVICKYRSNKRLSITKASISIYYPIEHVLIKN